MSAAPVDNVYEFDRSAQVSSKTKDEILAGARQQANDLQLKYAGRVTPLEAWKLFSTGAAVIVDVRTNEERIFVGHVPNTLHVAWQTGTSLNRNPRFVKEVESKVPSKEAFILLLCRSGKRSHDAADALSAAGFINVFNIAEGFEGDLNDQQQRGALGGWRHWALPWVQN